MLIKSKFIIMISIVLAILMIVPVNVYGSTAGQNNLHLKQPYLLNYNFQGKIDQKVKSLFEKRIIPQKYVFLPNLNAVRKGIGPLYTSAPAPMGLADYGVRTINGKNVTYSYKTPSIMGYVDINSMYNFYMLGDAPYTLTFQLNAVLNNVTIGGNSSYVFWTQNVVDYSSRTDTLQFIDNIWNFSSSAYNMTSNSIYSGNGTLVPGIFYYAVGPTIKVTYPFQLSLYLNTTVVNGKTAVFFNYTLKTSNKNYSKSGSYDEVLFNSTYGMSKNYVAPEPYFYVSGNTPTPSGLLNDAEMIIGGAGGGSNTNIYNLNGTINLEFYNRSANKMMIPPSLWDVGSDTGETSMGVSVSPYTGSKFYLNSGPSLIYMVYGEYPLVPGKLMVGAISPVNSFVFLSRGKTFNMSNSTWLPLRVGNLQGTYYFTLPNGSYSIYVEMSDHKPATFNDIPILSRYGLAVNYSYGIYTPLYAFSNSQISYLSINSNGNIVGNGTANNPYIVINNQYGPIMSEFGILNDFGFPVFTGVMFINTNSYVKMQGMPSFMINYINNPIVNFYRLPVTNYMGFEFYNVSHLIFTGDQYISGWISNISMPISGSMILWNVTNSLISSNYFYSEGISLYIYNPPNIRSNNVIWGNFFKESPLDLTFSSSGIQNITNPVGLYVDSGGNKIYNNYFDVQIPAVSPNVNVYEGTEAIYVNEWNISREPLSYAYNFDGIYLSGNIFNYGYQGGNFWYNFNGKVPFNDLGMIQTGGDYLPLSFYQVPVNFVESGLPANHPWSVGIFNPNDLLLYSQNSTQPTITFYLIPGTYTAYFENVSGYVVNISQMKINVQTFSNIYISFRPVFKLNLVENGLPVNVEWGININNGTYMTNNTTISLYMVENTYKYSVISPQGYEATKSSGIINLTSNITVIIKFLLLKYKITFDVLGLPANIPWYLNVTGNVNMNITSLTNYTVLNLPNGTYEYRIGAISSTYYPAVSHGMFSVYGVNYSINIPFNKYNLYGTVKFIESGLPNGTSWGVNINNANYTSSSGVLILNLPYGKYLFSAYIPNNYNYTITPSTGTVNVNSPSTTIFINFSIKYYQIEFTTNSNLKLNILVNGIQYVLIRELTLNVTNGTYIYSVIPPAGYSVNPSSGKIIISSMNSTLLPEQIYINVKQIMYNITFTISGLPHGQEWYVMINNQYYSSYGNTITVSLPYGSYQYSISLPSGYTSSITNGTISSNQLISNPTYSIYAYQKPVNIIGIQMTGSSVILFVLMIIFFIIIIVEAFIIATRLKKKKEPHEWREEIKNQ
ncbi:MAG: thermopsin [Thermoplasmata archaeon]